jgi:hypothetical protein
VLRGQAAYSARRNAITAADPLPNHIPQINEVIKYGRAGFTLLRHRILLGLSHIRSPPKVRQSR